MNIEYPVTFYFAGVIVIVLVWCLLTAGVRQQMANPVRLNVSRVGEGAAGLAVVAYVLHEAAHDLRGGFAELLAFFAKVPTFYAILPLPVLLSLGTLCLVTIISALRLIVGLQGPFPLMQKTMMVAGHVGWLAAGSALWLLGVFVPASWDYFGAGFVRGLNLALTALYLFVVVESAVAIVVLLIGGGGNPFKRYLRDRSGPLRPVGTANGTALWLWLRRSFSLAKSACLVAFGIAVAAFGAFEAAAPSAGFLQWLGHHGVTGIAGSALCRLGGVALIALAVWWIYDDVWPEAVEAWRGELP